MKGEAKTFSFKDFQNAEKSISGEFDTSGTTIPGVRDSFQIKQGPYSGACPNCGYCPCCGRTINQWPSYPYWRPYWYCSSNAPLATNTLNSSFGFSVGASN